MKKTVKLDFVGRKYVDVLRYLASAFPCSMYGFNAVDRFINITIDHTTYVWKWDTNDNVIFAGNFC